MDVSTITGVMAWLQSEKTSQADQKRSEIRLDFDPSDVARIHHKTQNKTGHQRSGKTEQSEISIAVVGLKKILSNLNWHSG